MKKKTYKVRVFWEQYPELSSIVEVEDVDSPYEAEEVAYGMSGTFFFEQGGSGSMPCPTDAECLNEKQDPVSFGAYLFKKPPACAGEPL